MWPKANQFITNLSNVYGVENLHFMKIPISELSESEAIYLERC
jgi:hypothetical protein